MILPNNGIQQFPKNGVAFGISGEDAHPSGGVGAQGEGEAGTNDVFDGGVEGGRGEGVEGVPEGGG